MEKQHAWPEGHWDWPIKVTHKHGLRCGPMIFLGGQVDLDSSGIVLDEGDLPAQIRAVMRHIDSVLTDLGVFLSDLVKLQVFYVPSPPLLDADVLAIIGACLPADARLAITMIPVPFLGYPGMRVEIEATAMRSEDGAALSRHLADPNGLAPLPLPFVHGLQCGTMLFVSGQPPRDAAGGVLNGGDIVAQSAHVMARIETILNALGADLQDTVKINRWYVGEGERADWEPAALAVARRFAEPGPAATGMPVPSYPDPQQRIMIDAIAMRDPAAAREHVWPEGHWDWPVHLPYRHGVKCGNMVFIGGQVPLTQNGIVIAPHDMAAQTRMSLDYIRKVLAGFGLTMDAVVKVLALYSAAGQPEELHTNLSIRSAAFTEPGPATTGIPLPSLAYPGMMIEIEIIAMVDQRQGSGSAP